MFISSILLVEETRVFR